MLSRRGYTLLPQGERRHFRLPPFGTVQTQPALSSVRPRGRIPSSLLLAPPRSPQAPANPPRAANAPTTTIRAVRVVRGIQKGRPRVPTDAMRGGSFRRALGLPVECLSAMPLGIAWRESSGGSPLLAVPESDGHGQLIGIQTRWFYQTSDGKCGNEKRCVRGSRRGLSIPANRKRKGRHVFVPEGPTDVLALDALGLYAIGTPNNAGGADLLVEWHRVNEDAEFVLLVENDRDGAEWPSMEGRFRIARELWQFGIVASIALTPDGAKDARAWFHAYGTSQQAGERFASKGLAGAVPFDGRFRDWQELAAAFDPARNKIMCTPKPPTHNFVARDALKPLVCNCSIPCRRGPKASFIGIKKYNNKEGFFARLRCCNWGCSSCIELGGDRRFGQ